MQYGADLRWGTPLKGLLVGASRLDEDITAKGLSVTPFDPGAGLLPYSESSKSDWTNQFYLQYTVGKLRIDSEYRRYLRDQILTSLYSENVTDVRGWYVAGSYRISKSLQLGSYYSRYTISSVFGGALAGLGPNQTDTSLPANHIYDKVITARGLQYGGDLPWNTPVKGMLIGVSRMNEDITADAIAKNPGGPGPAFFPEVDRSKADWINQFYGRVHAWGNCGSIRSIAVFCTTKYYTALRIVALTNVTDVRGCYVREPTEL